MSDATQLAVPIRRAWVLGLYRWLIGLAFLFAAFSAFPGSKWAIGLGVLVFNAGVEAVLLSMEVHAKVSEMSRERADMLTRHTAVLAAERRGLGDWPQGFWSEAHRRVNAEIEDGEPIGFWKSAGLVVGALAWRVVADVFGIALVMALTG